MTKLSRTPLALAVLLFALPAAASNEYFDLGTLIDAKPLNGAPSTLTVTIGAANDSAADKKTPPNRGPAMYRTLALFSDYTKATGGTLVITITVGRNVTTAKFAPNVCDSVTAGACVSVPAGVFQIDGTGGDSDDALRVGLRSFQAIKIVASMSGAAAGDIIKLTGYLTN